MSQASTSDRVTGTISKVSSYTMVYGYIAIWLVWAGLITFTGYRTEGLDEAILAAIFLIGPGIVALVVKAREDLAGVTRASLGGSSGEVAEDYTRGEMGTAQDEDDETA